MDDEEPMAVDPDSSTIAAAASPRAVSSDSCNHRRDSLEDADPTLKRKRQRLNGNTRRSRSMSAHHHLTSTGEDAVETRDVVTIDHLPTCSSPTSLNKLVANTYNFQESNPATPPARIPLHRRDSSKVTINVRPARTEHTADPAPVAGCTTASIVAGDINGHGPEGSLHEELIDSPSPCEGDTVVPISPSSSVRIQSPEVEIDEIDEMDQDSNGDHCPPMVTAFMTASSLPDRFPLVTQGTDPRAVVIQIYTAFEKGLSPLVDRPGSDAKDQHRTEGLVQDTLLEIRNWFAACLERGGDCASDWYDILTEDPDFWMEIPTLVNALLRTKYAFKEPIRRPSPDSNDGLRCSFEDFFVQFARLCRGSLLVDLQSLRTPDTSQRAPGLVSPPYQRTLALMLDPSIQHNTFWDLITEMTCSKPYHVAADIGVELISEPEGFLLDLVEYAALIAERIPQHHKLLPMLWNPISIAQRLVSMASLRRRLPSMEFHEIYSRSGQVSLIAAGMCRGVNLQLHLSIERQSPLPRGFVKQAGMYLPGLLHEIAKSDLELAQSMLAQQGFVADTVAAEHVPELLPRAWRLLFLKKCIIGGRMEVRAQGLDEMCEELVAAWTKHGTSSTGKVVMRHLADFILQSKLVDYLVGADSHLHLMEQSHNLVGFLMVTEKFTNDQTDSIWHTIKSSQDPRVVSAVLGLLQGTIHLSKYQTVIYLCEKLNELALESFDIPMLEYARLLLASAREKWRATAKAELDIQPFDVCIRLMRMATASSEDIEDGARAICEFALQELRELLGFGPSPDQRHRIYLECLEDLTCRSASATGNIYVLNALLDQQRTSAETTADLRMLTHKLDLTRILIEEVAHTLTLGPKLIIHRAILQPRLDLLARIILHQPSTITPQLAERLWYHLFGKGSRHAAQRDAAWLMLCNIMDGLLDGQPSNSFIDRCMTEFLPTLDPLHLTPAVLRFTKQAIVYEHRFLAPSTVQEHETLNVRGSEQVWRMILTAPEGTIELPAIQLLVDLYLDSDVIKKAPRSAVETAYLGLVDRCMHHLNQAAVRVRPVADGPTGGEDEQMIIVAPAGEMQAEEIQFSRALLVLEAFLRAVRVRGQFRAASRIVPECVAEPGMDDTFSGDPCRIRYQAFSGSNHPAMQHLEAGDLESCSALQQRLSRATGFRDFKVYCSGRQVNLRDKTSETIRSLQLGPTPFIIINQIHAIDEVEQGNLARDLTTIDLEVLKHFDELYDYLDLPENLARKTWTFLRTFPLQDRVRRAVMSKATPATELLPGGHAFKIIYNAQTLQVCLEAQLKLGLMDEEYIARGIHALSTALVDQSTLAGIGTDLRLQVLEELLNCFSRFLKEPVSNATSDTYFVDEQGLVDSLLAVLHQLRSEDAPGIGAASSVACACLTAILEASLRSVSLWNYFTSKDDAPKTIKHLILVDTRQQVRNRVAEIISGFCDTTSIQSKVGSDDFSMYFWCLFSTIIPETTHWPTGSGQFFETALSVFRMVGKMSEAALDFEAYVRDWAVLLLTHEHHEVVGKETVDTFVIGLSRLLHWCLRLAKANHRPIETDALAVEIFQKYLFPPLSSLEESIAIRELVPVLHSPSRQELQQLILLLSQDRRPYQGVLSLLDDLVTDASWDGLSWHLQRSEMIRSGTGYVGLHNLSNTCYLNSLFTQLFMNVNFRGFMLNARVADADGSQRLLSETQKLFAYMQNSWQAAVEPRDLAGSIRTYENEPIDVSVQMDVDEFYNLLFDRWEGQILSDEAKTRFRSFYGGQLVQQVKSKECAHVSEREEPFSAIQCDIKGKANLQESLRAYVEGDVMEGDNKYSCSSCERHVDAIKRTCLKEVPDNLIFHLKRFDFDLRNMQRSKINDQFDFPETIDMRPYKVEYLADSLSNAPQDLFELVGVLVHSGTAESGHYYSFVRERPNTDSRGTASWVQYNDSEVSRFDPANIRDYCFGGVETWSQSREPPVLVPKTYSAYMLFYERSTSLKRGQDEEKHCGGPNGPKKLPMPLSLKNHIACDNETFIRRYCLYDPHHASFVRSMFESLRHVNKGSCSEQHADEKTAINMLGSHLDQVVIRVKDVPDFDGLIQALMKLNSSCARCCKLTIDWLVASPEAMRHLLLRNPTPRVRQDFSRMVLKALHYLRARDPLLYGIASVEDDREEWTSGTGAFGGVLRCLDGFWDVIDLSLRAWDDYFGFLTQLAALGDFEIMAILHKGFLRRCLVILVVEIHPSFRAEYSRMIRLLDKGRKVSYAKLLELLQLLLGNLDLRHRPAAQDEDSRYVDFDLESYPLTHAEEECLTLHLRHNRSLVFLSKMLDVGQNLGSAKKIVAQMVSAEPELGLLTKLHKTFVAGIAIDPASLASPYLQAALSFCEHAPFPNEVQDIIGRTARDMASIGSHGGREHLSFFGSMFSLQNGRWPSSALFFKARVLECIASWAPVLLVYWDASVREDTESHLEKMVFQYGTPAEMVNERLAECTERAARDLAEACLEKAHEKWIDPHLRTDARWMESLMHVLDRCRPYFEGDEGDFDSRCDLVMHLLRELVIDDIEDAASEEWDNDSNMGSDSSDVDPVALAVENISP